MAVIILIIILVALLALLFICSQGMGIDSVPAIVKLVGFIVSLIVAVVVILQASGVNIGA